MLLTVGDIYDYVREHLFKGNAGTLAPEEFDVLYNGVALEFVQGRSSVAESGQRSLDDLRDLMTGPVTIANAGGAAPGMESFPLPAQPDRRYLHALSIGFVVVGPGCQKDKVMGARPLRRDYRHEGRRNPFHAPTPMRPRYWFDGGSVKVDCGDGAYASRMVLEYIRWPRQVSVVNGIDPDVGPDVNQKIADFTVRRYLEAVESGRYRTTLNEQQLTP